MKWLFVALALVAAPHARAEDARVADVLNRTGFTGYALVTRGDATLVDRAVVCPTKPDAQVIACGAPAPDAGKRRWPWASVSKQMMAVLVMQQVEAGRLTLEDSIDRWLPPLGGKLAAPTIRQLLQHQSGLRNSNDSPPDANGFPSFYSTPLGTADWCLADRKAPGGSWTYNNCDYVVLDRVLQKATGKSAKRLFADGIATPLGLKASYFLPGADPAEPLGKLTARAFVGFGAGGALTGPPHELLTIDRALLAGKLLSAQSRAAMWAGDPKLGYMALGQWAFDAPLKGCAKPVRIIERRGGIATTQVRNILLPDSGAIVILFTNDGDFDFGEIWQGKGLSHDLLAVVACP